MAKSSTMQKVLSEVGTFVNAKKGSWEHNDWEGFLEKIDKLHIAMDDECKRNLGNLLESSRYFFLLPPDNAKASAKSNRKPIPTPKTKRKS